MFEPFQKEKKKRKKIDKDIDPLKTIGLTDLERLNFIKYGIFKKIKPKGNK